MQPVVDSRSGQHVGKVGLLELAKQLGNVSQACRSAGAWTHRDAAEIQLLQKLADAALMQMNIEFGGDAVTQVGTAPAYHGVGLGIRAVFHPLRHLAQLGFGQTRLTPRLAPPTAADDHPAAWQSPEGAAPAWRQPSAPPPPATAKYSDLGV